MEDMLVVAGKLDNIIGLLVVHIADGTRLITLKDHVRCDVLNRVEEVMALDCL